MSDFSAYAQIGQIVQLSLAPVFLLVAIGSFLNVVTQRLARVVDRARIVEAEIASAEQAEVRALRLRELRALDRRIVWANAAINLCVVAALLVALLVALIFLGGIAGLDMALPIALLFVLAMLGVIAGLGAFLAEIAIATRTLRIGADVLAGRRPAESEPGQ